jgi:hypothetical protein
MYHRVRSEGGFVLPVYNVLGKIVLSVIQYKDRCVLPDGQTVASHHDNGEDDGQSEAEQVYSSCDFYECTTIEEPLKAGTEERPSIRVLSISIVPPVIQRWTTAAPRRKNSVPPFEIRLCWPKF